jgi:hypothetical protein
MAHLGARFFEVFGEFHLIFCNLKPLPGLIGL